MKNFKEKLRNIPSKVLFLTLLVFLIIPMPVETCAIIFGSGCGISIVSGFYAIYPMIIFLFFGRFVNLIFLTIAIGVSYFIAKSINDFFKDKGKIIYFTKFLIVLSIFELFLFFVYNPVLPREDRKVSDTLVFINENNSDNFHLCQKIKVPFRRIGYPDSDYYIEEIDRMKKLCFERTYNNKLTIIKEKLDAVLCDDFGNVKSDGIFLRSKCYYELAPLTLNETLCNYKFSENKELNDEMNRSCIYNTKKQISGGIYVDGFVIPVDSSIKVGIIPLTDIERALYWRNLLIPINNSNGYFRYESVPLRYKWGDSPTYIENFEIYAEKNGIIYRKNFTCSIIGFNFNCHFIINLNDTPKYKNRNLVLYSKINYSEKEILQDDETGSKIISKGFDSTEKLYWYEVEYDASLLDPPTRGGAMSLYLYYDKFANRYPGLRLKLEKAKPVYVGQSPSNEVSLW